MLPLLFPHDRVTETADDLNAAFEQLREAGNDEVQHRRALKATLNELYRVREYRHIHSNGQFYPYARKCDQGMTTLGVIYLRGVLTHHLTKPVSPKLAALYPSKTLQPSQDLLPGANFIWISAAELAQVHPRDHPQAARGRPYYESHVADRLMLATIRLSIAFLLTDPAVAQFCPV